MLKKGIIYLVLFAIFCLFGNSYLEYCVAQQSKNQSPYYLSFASIGANLLESRLDCWAKINTGKSTEELDQILLQLLNHLKLPADPNEFLREENNDTITVEYILNLSELNFDFLLQTNKAGDNSNLLVTVIDKGDDRQIQHYEEQMKKLYKCTTYYHYQGVINARPDTEGQQELLKIMLANLHATPNNMYNQGPMSSVTGYSPWLKQDSVTVSGQPCNLQAAIRAGNDGKTSVYLGTPLLLNDY